MKESKPLVSFIVPAYNVERYIEKCILSIINQKYRNIECVIIDDGSTDNTGSLLENLVELDNRLKVLHKKNEGVSSARNAGMELSSGEYLVFVDGDDYIAPEYTSYMLGLITRNDSDFGLSLNCFHKKGEKQVSEEKIFCLNSEEATALLLGPRVIVGCWNKIYKASFVRENNLKFQTNLFYGEGLFFINQVAQKAKKVVVGNRKVYYYRRNNEASACSHFNVSKLYNGNRSIDEIEKSLIIKTPKIMGMLSWHRCQFKMGAVVQMKAAGITIDTYDYYKDNLSYVRHHVIECLGLEDINLYNKGLIVGTAISPVIMAVLYKIRKYYNRNHSFD